MRAGTPGSGGRTGRAPPSVGAWSVSDWAAALGGAVVGVPGVRPVAGITDDSRRVGAGHLFFARAGAGGSGRRHIPDAMARGAVAVVADENLGTVPHIRVDDAAAALVHAADLVHGAPQEALDLVAVTGTKGKTTTAYLVRAALERAGRKTAVLGTIAHDLGDGAPRPALNTTPGALELRALLAAARDAGCRAAVMEVSSHALAQGRTAGLAFAAAVFTNLGRDHLDYHLTREAYFGAKALLFEGLDPRATAILNADDPQASAMRARCTGRVLTYGEGEGADLRATDLELAVDRTTFTFHRAGVGRRIEAGLVGRHNVSNVLAAVGAAVALGVDAGAALEGAAAVRGVRGRLEPVAADADVHVFVDYAHTEESLRQVLGFLGDVGARPLWCVVGCGGDRDRTKRPLMARAAAQLADHVVLTSDNPRTEDPAAILRDMEAGLDEAMRSAVETIVDRREAIRRAVAGAPPGATVLIAGKGHEDYQLLGTTKIPFDDAAEAEAALALRPASPSRTDPEAEPFARPGAAPRPW